MVIWCMCFSSILISREGILTFLVLVMRVYG